MQKCKKTQVQVMSIFENIILISISDNRARSHNARNNYLQGRFKMAKHFYPRHVSSNIFFVVSVTRCNKCWQVLLCFCDKLVQFYTPAEISARTFQSWHFIFRWKSRWPVHFQQCYTNMCICVCSLKGHTSGLVHVNAPTGTKCYLLFKKMPTVLT